ncbi:MAG: NAD(P)/FAD-dependent oxidoreductase [Pyrinomonadaceae bacterium MAG19_C2-C3]|nr:NAD(P)/FAD-dependent oxidoreductase [Pyrinomonadaceae bacterium MAG19_C2-C3]
MNSSQRILIVGGGFGGVFTALELAGDAEVTLVAPDDYFLCTPLLYEYLSREVEAWHIAPPFKELLDDKVRFIRGEVTEIDFSAREATIKGRTRRAGYDVLVLAVGGTTNYFGTEGAEEYAIPFRRLPDADRLRQRMIDTLDRIAPDSDAQDARAQATFAVIGGGASGAETASKMGDLLNDAFRRRGLPGVPRVMLIEMGNRIVPGMGDDLHDYVEHSLRESGVEIHTNTRVNRVTESSIVFEHGGREEEIETAGVVWTGGVRVAPLVEDLALKRDDRNKIIIHNTLQTQSYAEVFALGDIALYTNADAKLSGTAQLAFQQSSLAGTNIKAFLKGEELQTRYLRVQGEAVSLGTENAAVETAGQIVHGTLARQARFALYTTRLPTWHHRLRVGASWFFGGTLPRPLGL